MSACSGLTWFGVVLENRQIRIVHLFMPAQIVLPYSNTYGNVANELFRMYFLLLYVYTAKSRWFVTFGGNFFFLRAFDKVISQDLPPNPDFLTLLAVICNFRKVILSLEVLHLPPNSDVLKLLAVICKFHKEMRSHEALHLPPNFWESSVLAVISNFHLFAMQ